MTLFEVTAPFKLTALVKLTAVTELIGVFKLDVLLECTPQDRPTVRIDRLTTLLFKGVAMTSFAIDWFGLFRLEWLLPF